jgi:AcrR family transcriptional regulator
MIMAVREDDLTARARIRDAALRLFAERGIEAATIRDIAAAAGVSSGLIRHHFGSKEDLRDACDDYARERAMELADEMLGGRMGDPAAVASTQPEAMLLQTYLVRSMMDGSAKAEALFDTMVAEGMRWFDTHNVESADALAYSAVLAAMKLGVFILRDQLSRVFGVDVGTPQGHARMMRGFIDVFSIPLLTPEQVDQARAAFDRLQAQPPVKARDVRVPTRSDSE